MDRQQQLINLWNQSPEMHAEAAQFFKSEAWKCLNDIIDCDPAPISEFMAEDDSAARYHYGLGFRERRTAIEQLDKPIELPEPPDPLVDSALEPEEDFQLRGNPTG